MPDRPQSASEQPSVSSAFRETFLYWIEDPHHNETVRRFGDLFDQLVGEARLVVRNPREKTPDPTWVAATVLAVLLDLAHLRAVLFDIADNIGAALPAEEVRLMLAVADLLPEYDAFAGKLRVAYNAAVGGRSDVS